MPGSWYGLAPLPNTVQDSVEGDSRALPLRHRLYVALSGCKEELEDFETSCKEFWSPASYFVVLGDFISLSLSLSLSAFHHQPSFGFWLGPLFTILYGRPTTGEDSNGWERTHHPMLQTHLQAALVQWSLSRVGRLIFFFSKPQMNRDCCFFFLKIFMYLAASRLSCSTWALSLRCPRSLAVAHGAGVHGLST